MLRPDTAFLRAKSMSLSDMQPKTRITEDEVACHSDILFLKSLLNPSMLPIAQHFCVLRSLAHEEVGS